MNGGRTGSALILGVCILLGLSSLGYLLGQAAIEYRAHERSVTVKGLAEREVVADVVIWPIAFSEAGNDLSGLYQALEKATDSIKGYLRAQGVADSDISVSPPAITDKLAQPVPVTIKGFWAAVKDIAIQEAMVCSCSSRPSGVGALLSNWWAMTKPRRAMASGLPRKQSVAMSSK